MGRGHVSRPRSYVPGRYTMQIIIRECIIQQIRPKDVHKYLSVRNPVIVEQFMTTANWAPLLTDPFLCLYEAHGLQGFSPKNVNNLALSFNFISRYIENVYLLNNTNLCDFVDHIYPIELEIQDGAYTARSVTKELIQSIKHIFKKKIP